MAKVTHFDMSADDPGRAMRFYERVFGWRFIKWNGPTDYWMIDSGEGMGIDGGMAPRDERMPQLYCTITIEDVDGCLDRVVGEGGQIVLPKMPIPGVGWHALFRDTEGNLFGIMQEDRDAR